MYHSGAGAGSDLFNLNLNCSKVLCEFTVMLEKKTYLLLPKFRVPNDDSEFMCVLQKDSEEGAGQRARYTHTHFSDEHSPDFMHLA